MTLERGINLYTQDQRADRFGIRPKFRPGVQKFGASTWLPSLGYHDRERNEALDWFEERGVGDFYCQMSVSGDHAVDPVRIIEIIDNILERGGTVTLCIVNFTRAALARLSASQKAAIVAAPISKKGEGYAAKLAMSLGVNAGVKAIISFILEHVQTALAPYGKYKGNPNVRWRFQSETFDWPDVSPERNAATAVACGWSAVPDLDAIAAVWAQAEALIAKLGFTLYAKKVVHAYFQQASWKDPNNPTAPPQPYISQWYLGYPEGPEAWATFEFNAPNPEELMRLGLDLADRGSEEEYLHTWNLCYQGYARAEKRESVEQYRSVEKARSWLGGATSAGNEGVAVLNPAMDKAAMQLGELLRLRAA